MNDYVETSHMAADNEEANKAHKAIDVCDNNCEWGETQRTPLSEHGTGIYGYASMRTCLRCGEVEMGDARYSDSGYRQQP